MSEVRIRPAERRDAEALGVMSGELMSQHHRVDPERFLAVGDRERGYGGWLGREAGRPGAVVLVATRGEAVVGYAYGTLEGRDWARLLDDHGAIHDLFVDASARRTGVGQALLRALIGRLEALGAPRLVLSTMIGNEAAQRVFAAAGFRPTMLEMTRSGG